MIHRKNQHGQRISRHGYWAGGLSGVSDAVNIHLDRFVFQGQTTGDPFGQILVGTRIQQGLEQLRPNHVEGRFVVTEHRHGTVAGLAQHVVRVFLQLGYAHRDIRIDRIHRIN
jgi:hypothetical protein